MRASEPNRSYAEAMREACETLVEAIAGANERALTFAIASNRAAADLALGGIGFVATFYATYFNTLRGLAKTEPSRPQTLPMPSVN